jgi:hypothetical protein
VSVDGSYLLCTGAFLTTSWSITALHCLKAWVFFGEVFVVEKSRRSKVYRSAFWIFSVSITFYW